MASVTNINEVLEGHVSLEVECVDRMLLNAYVPNLQVGGQVVLFLTRHLGNPVPSPALFSQIGNRFVRDVKAFAQANGIPILRLKRPDRSRWDDRKIDHVRPYIAAAEAQGRFGVVAIVSAQEFQWVFGGRNRSDTPGVGFDFTKASRRVGVYYFYVLDPDFGVGFIKICTYFPYPAKVWVNGHEWAKRQLDQASIGYTALANGFATCDQPDTLQAICDRFGPADVHGFFDRWICQIPTPFTTQDRAAGYWWELSMRQVEVSRTLVIDDPRRARRFFEALVADNIGIGRPEEVAVVFARQVRKTTPGQFRTRIFGPGTEVKMDFAYKHSRVKQYLKEGRAFRIETVINKPSDIGVLARLEHLPELIDKAHEINARLLTLEHAGQGCAIGEDLFDRLHQPYTREGQRTGALRFGDPRAMALAGALCCIVHTVTGFTNKSLRGLVAGLLGADYSTNQMGYDLRRLRLHGLIERIPGTITYQLTPQGTRAAVFYTKLRDRLLGPLLDAADEPPAPIELRRALKHIDHTLDTYIHNARLATAA
jgi:catechol 2,3-dioxygenase-like lactoylglutathione lyase family enzyme